MIPGNYKLLVDTSTIPASKYSIVSDQVVYPLSSFNGMAVHSQYSYGGIFTLASSSPALNIDIPVDPLFSQSGLMVQKTARDSSIELGDFTNYSITVSNQGDVLARDVKLQDSCHVVLAMCRIPCVLMANQWPTRKVVKALT